MPQAAVLRGVTRSGNWLITDVWHGGAAGWQLVARSAILKAKPLDDTAKQELHTHTDVWGHILDREAWLAYATAPRRDPGADRLRRCQHAVHRRRGDRDRPQ